MAINNPLLGLGNELRDSCVFAVCPFTGSFRDWSPSNLTPTVNGSCYWDRTSDKSCLNSDGASGYLDYIDPTTLDFSTGFSCFVGFRLRNISSAVGDYQCLVGGNAAFYFDIPATSDKLRAFSNTWAANVIQGSTDVTAIEDHTATITYDTTSGARNLYLDAVNDGSNVTSGTIAIPVLNLMNATAVVERYVYGGEYCALMFNRELVASEVAFLDNWIRSRRTPNKVWNGFTRPFTPDLNREENLIAAWDLSKRYNNVIPDLVSGTSDGDIIGNFQVNATGELGLIGQFDGATSAIDCGNDSSLRPADALTLVTIIKSKTGANQELVNYRKTISDSMYALYQIRDESANVCVDDGSAKGADLIGRYPNTYNFSDSVWHHVALVFSRANQTITAYLDGVAGTPIATGGDYPLNSAGPGIDKLYFGCATPILRWADAEIASVKLYSEAKSADWMWRDYQESLASRLVFSAGLQTTQISLSVEGGTAHTRLSNTAYNFGDAAGRFFVEEDATVETGKRINCDTNGIIYRPNNLAYGTYEIGFIKDDAGACYWTFISDSVTDQTNPVGYQVYIGANETMILRSINGGAVQETLASTVAGYITPDVPYRMRITRRVYDGQLTWYIKGGAWSDWTLVVPGGGGANPSTNTFTKTSRYCVFDFDSASKIFDERQYIGVVPPL